MTFPPQVCPHCRMVHYSPVCCWVCKTPTPQYVALKKVGV